MTYNCLAGIGIPRHDPGELELEEGDLAAGVDHGVVLVVGAEDQVVPVHWTTRWKTAVTNIAFFNLGCMIYLTLESRETDLTFSAAGLYGSYW